MKFVVVVADAGAFARSVAVLAHDRRRLPTAKLRNPARSPRQAPATYKAKFDTSPGRSSSRCTATGRRSAPIASTTSSRTASTTTCGSSACVPNFMVQFGINGNPAVQAALEQRATQGRSGQAEQQARLRHVRQTAAPNSRIDAGLHQLQGQQRRSTRRASRRSAGHRRAWTSSTRSYSEYGEEARTRASITVAGQRVPDKDFPKLDYIKKATIEK